MDYRYLEAYISTAHRLSFTKAAQDLGITQAAISRQIRLLEESLDMQLLIRSPHRVLLTPEGQRLYEQSSKFNSWINDDLRGGTQTIRVAALQGIIESWMYKVIADHFKDTNVNFEVQMGSQEEIDRAIEDGKVDIGLNSHKIENDYLTSFKLFREKIVIVSKKPIDIKKLEQYPWATFDPNLYLIPYCKRKARRIIQVESINASLSLVAKGAGITMAPLHLVPNPQAFKIYTVDQFKTEFIWATTFNYTKLPKHLQGFIKLLRAEAERMLRQ